MTEGVLVTLPARYDLLAKNKPIVELMNSKGQDPAKVAEGLRGNTIDTAMGPLSGDQKGDLIGFEFRIYQWHADGTGSPM
mgnify:CR=1 FL=1|tara:strand:- start:263 stop:502 length:240 start_codon:yes stop_codon:yes gene_type:complete